MNNQSVNNNQAIQIVEVNTQGDTLTLNTEILETILNRPEIRDRKLAVISITGAVRKGKSFLLNFFIRYLKAKYSNVGSVDNWLGNDNQPLTGFSWRGGSERNTIGVLVWPEIFLHDFPNGQKVAIMLIDTQGMFDSKTTFDGNVTIFALSAMISSVQIYNVSNNIQEDQLQYLSLFAEYGKLALENPLNKPFQKLIFMVRDWFYPYEAEYGFIGGRQILRRSLAVKDNDDDETRELRRNIQACFDEIDCFLMPYPGSAVATNPNFNGSNGQIDEDFLRLLKDFVPNVVGPQKLLTKKVNGVDIRASDFVHYLRSYMKVLTGSKLPSPKTILSATADAQNLAAISDAKEVYTDLMEKTVKTKSPYLSHGELLNLHRQNNEKAVRKYEDIPKLHSTDKPAESYENELDETLKKNFNYYLIKNEKNRPDLSPQVEQLIDSMTKERALSDKLNTENTQLIMGMIEAMNRDAEKYRQQIQELTEAFKASQKQGWGIMEVVKVIVEVVPYIAPLFL